MENERYFIPVLLDQRRHKINSGLYYFLQVEFAYNSNHIEGSRLSKDQTRSLFETRTIGGESVPADDIIETANHFRCFDHVIDTYNEPLTEDYLKTLHRILKTNTFSSQSDEAVVGDYKKYDNMVGDVMTTTVENVHEEIVALIDRYEDLEEIILDDIVAFHVAFEKIHPFYDGNGRVGRLIMFKECLRHGIVPFIVNDKDKMFYSMGLSEWQIQGKKDRLLGVCSLMQDDMSAVFDHFKIMHDKDSFKPVP